MLRSILLCSVLLFALNEPACAPADAKDQSQQIQPGQNPDPDNHTGEAAPRPRYKAQPTFEAREKEGDQ